MKKMSRFFVLLCCCMIAAPAFSATVGIFDKTADWTLATGEKVPGSITAAGTGDAAVYTLKGNGDDIWNNADEGFFGYTTQTGSFSIQAKVKWVNPGDNYGANAANYEWAKVGVMIRDKAEDNGSKHFSLVQRAGSGTPSDMFSIQMRQSSAGASRSYDVTFGAPDGIWLRVSRYAPLNFFWAEYSEDGKTWTMITSTTAIGMGDSVSTGLCITNHYNDKTLAEATVSEVKITPITDAPAAVIKPKLGDFDGNVDIGNYTLEGGAKYDTATKTYKVEGSGDDIWNNADAFHYVYKKMAGAFEIQGDYIITGIAEATWTKAGLMVRETLGTSSAYAMGLVRSNNDFAMAGRALSEGGSTDSTYVVPADPGIANRYKVVKVGNTVSGFMWNDADQKWVFHSAKPIPKNNDYFVGLAMTSHDVAQVAEAEFSNIKVTSLPFDIYTSVSKDSVVQGQSIDVKFEVKIADGVTTGFTIAQIYSTTAAISNLKATAGTATTDKNGKVNWTGTALTGTATLTYTLNAPETEKGTYTITTTYDDGKGFSGSINPVSIGIESAKPLDLGLFAGFAAIGTTNKGKVLHDGADWSVIGSGSDIWNNSDGCELLYVGVTGDFTLSIDKAFIGGWGANPSSDGWQKMGIMARQSLDADSAHATALIRQSDQAYMIQWRTDKAGASSSGDGTALTTLADHGGKLMMKREGDTFSAYYIDSTGAEVFQNSADVVMTDPIYVGVVVTAHSDGALSAGTFANPKFTGKTAPVQGADPGVEEWMMF